MARPGQLRPKQGTAPAGSKGVNAETRLLEATERLLRTMPLRDLSVEDVLEESGVSRRTFYVYFASKYGLVMRLAEDALGDIFDNLAPLVQRGEDEHGPEALRRVIEGGTAIWSEHRALLRAVIDHWQEVEDLRQVWLTTVDRMADALAVEIQRERAAGAAPPGPDARALAATLVYATANVLHILWLKEIPQLSVTPTAVIDSIIAMWVGAIYGGQATPSA